MKEKILIKCVLNSLSAIFQKILLHTWQIYAGIIKLTQEVRSLKNMFQLTFFVQLYYSFRHLFVMQSEFVSFLSVVD